VRGGYGDLLPVRVSAGNGASVRTFVYPRNGDDPTAESVLQSFTGSGGGDFSTLLGRVKGTLYVGRTSAGGRGASIDLGKAGAVTFSKECDFILQLKDSAVTALEADDAVTATIGGRRIKLSPFKPLTLEGRHTKTEQ